MTKYKQIKRLTEYANHLENNNHPEQAQAVRRQLARTNPNSNSHIIRELRTRFTAEELKAPAKPKQIKPSPESKSVPQAQNPSPVVIEQPDDKNKLNIEIKLNHNEEKSELSVPVIIALGQAYLTLLTGSTDYDLGAEQFRNLGEFLLGLARKENNKIDFSVSSGFYEAIGQALIMSKSKQPKNLQTYYGLLEPNPEPGNVGFSFTVFAAASCPDLYISKTVAMVTARTLDRFISPFKNAKPHEPIFEDVIEGETPDMRAVRIMVEHDFAEKGWPREMLPNLFGKKYFIRQGPKFPAEQLKQFNEYHLSIPRPANLPANVMAQLDARNYDKAAQLMVQACTEEQMKSLSTYLLQALTQFDKLDNVITHGAEEGLNTESRQQSTPGFSM